MAIDLVRVRADTRGCEAVTHLNNAGAALPPAIVTDTVLEQVRADEVFGGYEAQEMAEDALRRAHDAVGALVGGAAQEVAFFDNSSRAWQSAIYALPWREGDHVLASEAEYPSNVYSLLYLRDRFGVQATYVPNDRYGQIDVAALEAAITPRTKLICLTHVPTWGGLINPAAAVGAIAKAHGITYALDACQSVGHLHVDVRDIQCDILAAAGRKYLRGPRGTGFAWVRSELLETMVPQFSDGHSANWTAPETMTLAPGAGRFELFERSVALQLGLGAAARYATEIGTRAIEQRVTLLGAALRAQLASVPGVRVLDRGERLSGIVTFVVDGFGAAEIRDALKAEAINVSVTGAGGAMRTFPQLGLDAVVRASVHYYNTEEELASVTSVVAGLVA